MRWMLILLFVGLGLGGTGVYLLLATNITQDWGMSGIGLVVVLITIGVFLVVPAKIYIILRFTRGARRNSIR